VASLVLWFGSDDWVIDQINTEATRTLMPSPRQEILINSGGPQAPSSNGIAARHTAADASSVVFTVDVRI